MQQTAHQCVLHTPSPAFCHLQQQHFRRRSPFPKAHAKQNQHQRQQRAWHCNPLRLLAASSPDAELASTQEPTFKGEDAASFRVEEQSTAKWIFFTLELSVVLAILYAVWIAPGTGLAKPFVDGIESFSPSSEVTMILVFGVFALLHSGLAYLRPYGENLIGPRAFRVLFAALSLPLALLAVVYFINHRYDGMALWSVRGMPYVHELVWVLNFISFFFLYPSTFNLLEVAAIDKPKVHMYETGVMRITRHPQALGQGLWCAAHTLWIGSSFMMVTSAALMAHHLFGCWHGDLRLKRKYGEGFEAVKQRTSTIPFQAILQGRQQLPQEYYKEFLRLPYITIFFLTLGTYYAHPLMQLWSYKLGW